MSDGKSFFSTLEFETAPTDINEYRLKKEAVKNMPDPEKQITFGKHNGKTFEKIPLSYLYWCWQQEFVEEQHPFLYKYCCDCHKANFFDDIERDEHDAWDCPDW